MIDKVIRFCLENRLVVALIVIAVIGWGVLVAPFDWDVGALPRNPVPTDAIPDIGENQQIIFTECFSAEAASSGESFANSARILSMSVCPCSLCFP